MSNISATSGAELLCPLLQAMKNHTVNIDRKTNLVLVCIHSLVSCLGILENALILWVLGFRLRRRTVASVWVLNLAMSDFLTTLTLPLFTHYLGSYHSWNLGDPLCKIQSSIFFLNMFVSAFLLAAISLDRCLLVVKPVWCQNHRSVAGAWKVCALGWLWAAFNTLPYVLFRTLTETHDGRRLCYHNFALYLSSHATLKQNCETRQATTAISKLLLAFLFPLMVIAWSYNQICFKLRMKERRRRKLSANRLADKQIFSNKSGATGITNTPTTTTMFFKPPTTLSATKSNQAKSNQLSRSFTRMVTFVILAFALCWAPYHIFCIIEVTAQYWPENLKLVETGLHFATTSAFLNPILNPILYAFSCPDFCGRIRQSVGAVFDGLVEEREGLLMVPGRTFMAHLRRKNIRDASTGTPRPSGGLEDIHMDHKRQESKDDIEDK